jgi:hypothetical protein
MFSLFKKKQAKFFKEDLKSPPCVRTFFSRFPRFFRKKRELYRDFEMLLIYLVRNVACQHTDRFS